ncbi:43kDa postsynaptic protein [Trema orientale]|uniref:RING-type E3 ubiquitin transferase n=1 Tax=Trema orientale TaxID=63057 RepID=A0A2P5FAD6_TREOI|nr:43kDa postsynaptic protein [Trema orientale]
MASSNSDSSYYYHTYVSAQNMTNPDDPSLHQSLPHPQFSMFFKFSQVYLSDDIRIKNNSITEENIFQEIVVPTNYLVSNEGGFFINWALSRISHSIPLLCLNQLRWKELRPMRPNLARPQRVSLDELVTKILEVVGEIVRDGSRLGRNTMGMLVTIEKRSVIPHQRYTELLGAGRHLPRSTTLSPIVLEYLAVRDEDTQRALTESAAAVVFRSAPAAKSAVEALEKLIHEYDGVESSDELLCVICLEDILTGSRLIRFPCSHVFHEDCVLRWLESSHNCPLCRFELPTSDDV